MSFTFFNQTALSPVTGVGGNNMTYSMQTVRTESVQDIPLGHVLVANELHKLVIRGLPSSGGVPMTTQNGAGWQFYPSSAFLSSPLLHEIVITPTVATGDFAFGYVTDVNTMQVNSVVARLCTIAAPLSGGAAPFSGGAAPTTEGSVAPDSVAVPSVVVQKPPVGPKTTTKPAKPKLPIGKPPIGKAVKAPLGSSGGVKKRRVGKVFIGDPAHQITSRLYRNTEKAVVAFADKVAPGVFSIERDDSNPSRPNLLRIMRAVKRGDATRKVKIKSFSDVLDALHAMQPLDFYQEMKTNCMHYLEPGEVGLPVMQAHVSSSAMAAPPSSSSPASIADQVNALLDEEGDEEEEEEEEEEDDDDDDVAALFGSDSDE